MIETEQQIPTPLRHGLRMTKLAQALLAELDQQDKPVLSNYELFRIVLALYQRRNVPYLRDRLPTRASFRRPREILRVHGHIRPDIDYAGQWRIVSKPDLSPEELVCSIDPFCYISHLSAMQRYGLTNRRPEALIMTQPAPKVRREMLDKKMEADFGDVFSDLGHDVERLKAVIHPDIVRERRLTFVATKFYRNLMNVRGSFARIATIGQTFLEMIDNPDLCGGMLHVMDVWQEHAGNFLDEIIQVVGSSEKPILKVRAGYLLEGVLGIDDIRVEKWLAYAQRGSSRVLDPGKPFSSNFSEKWMLSLNA